MNLDGIENANLFNIRKPLPADADSAGAAKEAGAEKDSAAGAANDGAENGCAAAIGSDCCSWKIGAGAAAGANDCAGAG